MMGHGKPPRDADRRKAFEELIRRLHAWTISDDAIDRVHDMARASLNEVKALTEYEDGKVSRLSTVVAFLSAVVGAVFTRFAADYPWPGIQSLDASCASALTVSVYIAFFAYILLVTGSVLVILGAIKPTFNVPDTWTSPGQEGLPSSMVFYRGILDVSAAKWGQAFEQLGSGNETTSRNTTASAT